MTFIVYGPPACGKTRNAQALAAHFGASQIVDDWDARFHALTPGALHLTNEPADTLGRYYHAFESVEFDPSLSASAKFVRRRFRYEPVPAQAETGE